MCDTFLNVWEFEPRDISSDSGRLDQSAQLVASAQLHGGADSASHHVVVLLLWLTIICEDRIRILDVVLIAGFRPRFRPAIHGAIAVQSVSGFRHDEDMMRTCGCCF